MKVLITGAGGQLGTDLSALCAATGDDVHAFERGQLDIASVDHVRQVLEGHRPDVVVNCAAWTAVDDCEADPDRAQRINADAVANLRDAASSVGAHLVQVSTDYVFSGSKTSAYVEDDPTDPQSVYGRSKRDGELAAGTDATIVRTSWVCSAHGGNMVATILRAIENYPTLTFVSDQRGRPTFTTDLAAALRALAVERAAGVFHVANHGAVSWFEFTQAVLKEAGYDVDRVSPILTADLDPPRAAPRPANSVLATDKYEALQLAPLRHFTEPLAEVVPAYLP